MKGGSYYPPPDAFAFYLPFHYFYPKWWGVYLVLEPTLELAEFIRAQAGGILSSAESLAATRIFLYAHEAFHHIVESFGTRLEVTHRKPLFKEGFDRLYKRVYGSDACLEEALATASGLRRVKSRQGHRFPVPRHPGDLHQGTLAKIIKQAGLTMSLSEFMAARA